jgi:hypothetical protein
VYFTVICNVHPRATSFRAAPPAQFLCARGLASTVSATWPLSAFGQHASEVRGCGRSAYV